MTVGLGTSAAERVHPRGVAPRERPCEEVDRCRLDRRVVRERPAATAAGATWARRDDERRQGVLVTCRSLGPRLPSIGLVPRPGAARSALVMSTMVIARIQRGGGRTDD